MPRRDSIFVRGLEQHIDAGRSEQNDNGYADFVRMVSVPRYQERGHPNFSAIGDQFNRDGQTIKKWWIQHLLETGGYTVAKYQNPNFDKEAYWKKREQRKRGQDKA